MRKKTLIRENYDLSIESSDVTHEVSLDTNNQIVRA